MARAIDKLTEKQKLFVMEYAARMDRGAAIKAAGYVGKPKTLYNMSQRLLANPKVQAALAEVGTKLDSAELSVDHLVLRLSQFLNRNLLPFLDADGNLTCRPSELPEDIQQCVEGFDVEKEYDRETGEVSSEKIKLRFVPKVKAIELAMRWKQMLQPNNVTNIQNNISVDWSRFNEEPPDPIRDRIQQALGGNDV